MTQVLRDEDEQFVEVLFSGFSSPEYERQMKVLQQDYPFEDQFAEWVERGLWDENDITAAKQLYDENQSPQGVFRGGFANAIRELALAVAGSDKDRLEQIPLLLMPTGQVNARVFAAPSGIPIVVFNHGLIVQLLLIIRSTLAFITWHDEDPFCTDREPGYYGAALVGLAEAVIQGDMAPLVLHRETLRFESIGDYNQEAEMWVQLSEAFIVLHEFGHVVRGHLVDSAKKPASVGTVTASEYSRTQLDEFEADEYAFERIMAIGKGQLQPSDTAFIAGLVLRFFVLCEHLSAVKTETHPPTIERWKRIKALAQLDQNPGALAHRLDGAYTAIEEELLPILERRGYAAKRGQ